jgi:hypothetical protein
MNSSWVKTEIANARAREQQKRQMLFPITLVPFDRIKDWKLFDADRGRFRPTLFAALRYPQGLWARLPRGAPRLSFSSTARRERFRLNE